MKLTFYGGVNEIGGNKVLLEDMDTRVLLDFGMSFSERRRFYHEPYLSPRDEKGLLEFGILPALKGVYRFDPSRPVVDAVLLSHPHSDHASCVCFLNREIPVYCGETTSSLLRSLSEVRAKSFETDIDGLEVRTFRTGDRFKVGNLEVEPVHVDHSVPGAYGFIVHTSEGAVVYTGDFRVHGVKAQMTREFVEKAEQAEPAVMICEGTNIGGADVSSEDEVKAKLDKVVRETDRLVLADFSYADIDRFRTFYEVAQKNKRCLAISMRQAYIFDRLKHDEGLDLPEIDDGNLVVFQRGRKRFHKWEDELRTRLNVKESRDIKNMQESVLMVCSLFDLRELIDIRPKSGSSYIHSASEPVNEEGEIEFNKLLNWLDHFGLPMYQIHCSGHIMPNELKSITAEISPKKIYPIHTEHPELFAKFMANCGEIELPRKQDR
ncbi:MAG: MBL fold metallo-hydrolase [Candidatus Bathyarchaeia archaeon]